MLLLSGCDPANEVGLDVLPDEVPATATYIALPGRAATVLRDDSVLTANKANVIVGELLDTNVGNTTAEAYWQVSPLTVNLATPPSTTPVADSLVATFAINQFNGTADGGLKLNLYELASGFKDDTAYYAGSAGLRTEPMPLNSVPVDFRLRYDYRKDSVLATPWIIGSTKKRLDSTRVLLPIRVPITSADLKMRLVDKIGTPTFNSRDNLQAVLKGLALKVVTGSKGALVNINPSAGDTRLTLYYRYSAADTVRRTYVFSMGNRNTERYFTKISTTYATGPLEVFNRPASTQAQDTVTADVNNGFTAYLQGGLELGTRIKIAGFETLRAKQGRIVINRAELVVPVKSYATGVFAVPGQAFLVEVDAQNRPLKNGSELRTVQANGNDPTGTRAPAIVTYDAATRAYRVLLTSYLDARLNDKLLDQKGDAFWLLPSLPASTGLSLNRTLIDAVPGQIQLKVYYSELN